MSFVYVDETGDLGMRDTSSPTFILTAILLPDERTAKEYLRIPKRIRQRTLGKRLRHAPELKFSNSSPVIREAFLRRAAAIDLSVFSIIVDKRTVPAKVRTDIPFLYQYVLKQLFDQIIPAVSHNDQLTVTFDACLSRQQREALHLYLRTELYATHKRLPDLRFFHKNSQSDPGLQVTDFLAGAFGYKHNTRDAERERYLAVLAPRIACEKHAFEE